MRFKADLTLFFVALIWGSAFVAQRLAGMAGGVFLFNGARFLLAVAVLLPFVRFRERPGHGFFAWAFIAGVVMFAGTAFQQAGLAYTTAGNAGFLTSLYVVIVPFVLLAGWGEKPRLLSIGAVVLAAAGAFLLSTGGTFRLMRGDALELAGAVFWALHVVSLGKFASRFDPLAFSLGQFLVCGLLSLGASLAFEGPVLADAVSLAAPILYTGVLSVGVGYTLQVWGQRHTPPTDAALILSLEAVFAVIAGWLILDENLLPVQLAGCGLIFLGVMLTQVQNGRSGLK
ncbi:MAG: DMT family transporter [Chloroflexota bacterium]